MKRFVMALAALLASSCTTPSGSDLSSFDKQDAIVERCNKIYWDLTRPYVGNPSDEESLGRLAAKMQTDRSPLFQILDVPDDSAIDALVGDSKQGAEAYSALAINAARVLGDEQCGTSVYEYLVPMLFPTTNPVPGSPMENQFAKGGGRFDYDAYVFLLLLKHVSELSH